MKNPIRRPLFAFCAALLVVTAAVPAASAATYSIDPGHSSAMFNIRHFGVSNVYGAFWNVSGTVVYDANNPAASSIRISITTESLDTNSERRDGHIKSPDFLDAKQFPVMTFESTSVQVAGDGEFHVTGNFTLHGVTKEITAKAMLVGAAANPRSGNNMIGFETQFTIDRTDHDMNFMAGPLGTDVEILVSFEASEPSSE
jgi:polyisoprenoid-binding protein YceI